MSSVFIGSIGFFSSCIGMFAGGLLVYVLKINKYKEILYSLCAGLIFGLVMFEILPEGIEIGGLLSICVGLLGGFFVFHYLHKLSGKVFILTDKPSNDKLLHTAFILSFSIALHNLPSGFVLGGEINSATFVSLMLTLFLHNIPEGIVVFTPLYIAGTSIFGLLAISVLVAFPVGIGALINSMIQWDVPFVLSLIIGFAMGIILMVTIFEIFLESYTKERKWVAITMGLVGLITIKGYLFLL